MGDGLPREGQASGKFHSPLRNFLIDTSPTTTEEYMTMETPDDLQIPETTSNGVKFVMAAFSIITIGLVAVGAFCSHNDKIRSLAKKASWEGRIR